jgi:hypothetical protein
MKPFDDTGMLASLGGQSAPWIPLPLARRIVLHWAVRLLITWFGFGIRTAAIVAGFQALSVELAQSSQQERMALEQ